MAANFDLWEKDPFFSAAEEVQESADRMESTYRTWLHLMKNTSIEWNREDLRRDLSTAIDTAKWQLEEFERAVQSSYKNSGADEAKGRHRQFVLALEGKISLIQKSLQESADSDGNPSIPGVRLNEGERDEFALFLSGPMAAEDGIEIQIRGMSDNAVNLQDVDSLSASNGLCCAIRPSAPDAVKAQNAKLFGYRRTASACAEIGSWNITICENDSASQYAFLGTVESASNFKVPKNGLKKWKPEDQQQDDDVAFLRSQPQSRGTNLCHERNRNIDDCDDCYDKQLYGWYGALYRLLQRLQYQVQYVRSMQIIVWATLLLFPFVLFLVCILGRASIFSS